MNDLIVIMGATTEGGTMRKYIDQLTQAGIDHHVDWRTEWPNMNGGGTLAYKIQTMRESVQKFSHYKKMIFSCAFDVTFYGSKEDVLKKIPTDYVLLGAEKNCYPELVTVSSVSKHRYYNGGLLAGTPASFWKWMNRVERHSLYASHADGLDQAFFNRLLSQDSPLVEIDEQTSLFYCLFGGYEELMFHRGIPYNNDCDSRPHFIHANGKWPTEEMIAKYERSLQ